MSIFSQGYETVKSLMQGRWCSEPSVGTNALTGFKVTQEAGLVTIDHPYTRAP